MFEEKTLPYIGAKVSKDFRIERVINQPSATARRGRNCKIHVAISNPSDVSAEFDSEISAFENTFCADMPRTAASHGE